MKVIIFILSVSLNTVYSHAGRESHGILPKPTRFVCASEPGTGLSMQAILEARDTDVIKASFKLNQNDTKEFSCTDAYLTRILNQEMQSTVFCSQKLEQKFFLELQESKNGSQLKVWELQTRGGARLLATLPCR